MAFLGLIAHNVGRKRFRATVTAFAVAIGVMAVMALGVLTNSLEESATELLHVGNADFTVSQKHVDQILNSQIGEDDIKALGQIPGVQSAIGALIQTDRYNSDNPAVIEVGLAPSAQKEFGVNILTGRSYRPNSANEVMIGYQLAKQIGKHTGDTMRMGSRTLHVVGEYRTNIGYGNLTLMYPLAQFQGQNQVPGQVTLGFVKVKPGVPVSQVAKAINRRFVQLTAIQSATDFGQADLTGPLIRAANTGGTILAALIAVTGVLNTTLLSFFERTREFGVLRSIGWSRGRVMAMVIGEAVVVSLVGAALGLFLGWVAVNVLQHLSQLRGYFKPAYDSEIFIRALSFALVVAVLGAMYPAARAARLSPLEALRRE